jgi:Fic family protein
MAKKVEAQPTWMPPDPMLAPVAGGAEALTHPLDRFAGRWQKLRDVAPDTLSELRHVATIESVASSTRIEGAALSDSEVAAVLSGLSVDSFRARDEQLVRGYGELLETIFAGHVSIELNESTVKSLHQLLLRHSEKDAWHRGDYKTGPNHVEATHADGSRAVVFRTAPPAETRWWMPRLLDEFNTAWRSGSWHPLVLTADFVLWFLAIHPFQDGNGRMSRALTTLLLLKAGYEYVPYASLERVVEDNKVSYYAALRASQTTVVQDATQYREWLTFFLGAMRSQQQTLASTLERALALAGLVPSQQRILDFIQVHGPQSSTTLAAALVLSPRTARYHLAHLVQAGRLETSPRRAGRLYSLPSAPPS